MEYKVVKPEGAPEELNDKEWIDKFVNAWVFRCRMEANVGYENVNTVLKAFRAEVLKEAAAVVLDDFKKSRRRFEAQGMREDLPTIAGFLHGHRSAQLAIDSIIGDQRTETK